MAGKWDYGKRLSVPRPQIQSFPGSKEGRAWDEGFRYRYGGTAAQRPSTDNPYNSADFPAEFDGWDAGWSTADANSAGTRFMPATTGAPPT